ncbi:MAG: sugar phosphate isomerase/epimerase [Verrucomicrobiota bacterium]
MARPVTLFTGQWADLPAETMCEKTAAFGYDGIELACWGDHFEVGKALDDSGYVKAKKAQLKKHGLGCWAISNHLVGQAVCDRIDERHESILTPEIWGDGKPEGVRERAAEEMIRTAQAAKKFGVKVVNGFTGSSIWPLLYAFPPVTPKMIDDGFADFGQRWKPILDAFEKEGVKFALEVHPTEIAFDLATAERAIEAVDGHPAFGFNYDPSHFGYQGVDYVEFIYRFGERIFHCHVKDAAWSAQPKESGVFGGHLAWGDRRRYWDFRSPGHGDVDFEPIIRALNEVGYAGPLSVEWEDPGMDREHGATEAAAFVKTIDFKPSDVVFDAAFDKKEQ